MAEQPAGISRYHSEPVRLEYPPVPDHPFQIGLRGEPCVPPEGLSVRAEGEWVRKWRNGDQAREGRR